MAKTKAKTRKKTTKKMDIRQQAKDLIHEINDAWYDFSLVANEIAEKQLFLEWGYASAREYAEVELGIDYRTWLYRVKMGQAIVKHSLAKEDIAELGWAKFKDIAALIINDELPEDKTKELIEGVKEMSSREAQEFVRSVRSEYAAKPVVTKVSFKFKLVNEAAEVVDQALERARELTGFEDDNQALEYICADWLAAQSKKLNEAVLEQVEGWNAD